MTIRMCRTAEPVHDGSASSSTPPSARVIFNDHLPKEMPFINGLIKKKGRPAALLLLLPCRFGLKRTVQMLDELKELGFLYATKSGISIGIDDMLIPGRQVFASSKTPKRKSSKVQQQYLDGAITNGERYNKVIAIWSGHHRKKVAEQMFKAMERPGQGKASSIPIYVMADSGARGSKQQIRQLSGMRAA